MQATSLFRVPLIHLVQTNLIFNHIKGMLAKGFDVLIDENRLESVALMYDLFLRVGSSGINDLREAFSNYIKVRACRVARLLIAFFRLDSRPRSGHRRRERREDGRRSTRLQGEARSLSTRMLSQQ